MSGRILQAGVLTRTHQNDYSNFTEECEERKQRKTVGWKAEDADGMTPVKDDNAADSHFTR